MVFSVLLWVVLFVGLWLSIIGCIGPSTVRALGVGGGDGGEDRHQ